jgi:nitrilase
MERDSTPRYRNPFLPSIPSRRCKLEAGHLDGLCAAAARRRIAIYLGTVERPADRGSQSLYCSLIFIDPDGQIAQPHRKLMPTYEERLVWSPGDGAGLRTHPLRSFHAGGLNCWENWMPLPRAALYAQSEDLHVAVWPGSARNTRDITSFPASPPASNCGLRGSFYPACPRAARSVSFRMNPYLSN